jgi:quinol-cytochrome oxidoreductase complex cytochrome b subunit
VKISSYSPFIGDWMILSLLGGDTIGPATLSRVFALHVWVMPALLAPLTGFHLFLLRKHGEFGTKYEYSRRLAKMREQRQFEELSKSSENGEGHE